MGYTWFRAESLAVDHPKVMELATLLGAEIALADGYVLRLWSWVHRYAPSGSFSARAVSQLEAYLGRAGVITMFVEVGLVDTESDGFSVHDWADMQGALVEKSKRDAKMKRNKRRARGAQTARAGRVPGARAAPAQDRTDETGQDTTHEKDRAGEPRAPEQPADKPKTPDPRHAPMVKALTDRFAQVTGQKYPFTPRDAKAVTQLLALALEPTILAAWERALRHVGFPTVRTLSELVTHFAHFVTGPPVRGRTDDATAGEGTITMREIHP
jgi:hypothetical protein